MPLPYDDFREQMEAALTLVVTLIAQEAKDAEDQAYMPDSAQRRGDAHLMAVLAYQIAGTAAPGSVIAARAHALQRDLADS